jgi:RNA polymerase sigma factor (sigma-70 family)
LRLAANETRRLSYERRLLTRLAAARTLEQVAATADESDSRLLLQDALSNLTPRQRAVIVARFYLDLSEADTAAALGIRRGTVKSTTSRGLAALRHAMSAEANL